MRSIRHLVALIACAAVAVGVLAGPAAAASPLQILRDCSDDGRIQGNYSNADLHRALSNIRGDTAAYTNCAGAITAAIGSGDPNANSASNDGSGGAGGGSGGGSTADGRALDANGDGKVSSAERRAAERESSERRQIASIAEDIVDGGSGENGAGATGAITTGDASSGIPTPVVLALIALVLAGAGAGIWYAAQRYPAIGNALRRVPLPHRRH